MNSVKLQTEILKMAEKRDGWKHANFNVPYFEVNDRVWVCPDARWGMGIPKNQFYLDITKVWKDVLPFQGQSVTRNADYAEEAMDTETTVYMMYGRKKLSLRKFVVKDEEIFVDERYLKYFDPAAAFKGTNSKSPLYVYELDELVGLIFPLNYHSN